MKNIKNQKGFSLIELLVVFTVTAVIIATVYNTVFAVDEGKTAKVVNDDFRLLDRIVVQSRGPNSYTLDGLTVAEVAATDKSGKLSRDTNNDGTKDALFVGGKYEVLDLAEATVISNNDAYAAALGGFSDQDCVNVVQSLWGIVDEIEVVAAGSASAAIGTSIKTGLNARVDQTASTAITNGCANGDNNGIVLAKRLSS